jgi:hypothetical protein
VQRTVTKDVEMWRCEDASPELVEGWRSRICIFSNLHIFKFL